MANNYYTFTPTFVPGTQARSDQVNVQYAAIETAFDLLPTSVTALTRGTATWAGTTTGSGNAYVATIPDTRASDLVGDEIVFLADRTNTGAATLNVDGNGARSIVRADGVATSANDIQAGLIYAARYDATNVRWQLMVPSSSYLTDASASAAAAAASAAAASTSEGNAATSETNAAASEVAADASADLAMEWAVNVIDDDVTGFPGQYSALHWADGAGQAWATQAEDSPIQVTFGGDGATTYSAFHWAQKAAAIGSGASAVLTLHNNPNLINDSVPLITGDITPTTVAHLSYGFSEIQAKATQTTVGPLGLNALGGTVNVGGSGTSPVLNLADTDGEYQIDGAAVLRRNSTSATLLWNGVEKLLASDEGLIIRSAGNTDAENRYISLEHQDGVTERGRIGQVLGVDFTINNRIHGGNITLVAEAAAGTSRTLMTLDPDAITEIRATTDLELRSGVANLAVRGVGGVETELYHSGLLRAETIADGFSVFGTLNNNPAAGLTQDAHLQFRNRNGLVIGDIDWEASTQMAIINRVWGGPITLASFNASGVSTFLFSGDPDSDCNIYAGGDLRFTTTAGGIVSVRSDGNTDTERRSVYLTHSDGTNRAEIGHATSATLFLINRIHGGAVSLQGEDNGGTLRSLITSDPDADVKLHQVGVEVARTITAATGGWEVNNTLTGTGFERVLTVSDGIFYAKQNGNQAIGSTTPTAISALQVDLPTGTYRMECMYVITMANSDQLGVDIQFVDVNTAAIDSTEGHIVWTMSRNTAVTINGATSAGGEWATRGVDGGSELEQAILVPSAAGSVGFVVTATAHVRVTTAGTLDVLMSKNTTGTGAMTLQDGSHLTYTRISA